MDFNKELDRIHLIMKLLLQQIGDVNTGASERTYLKARLDEYKQVYKDILTQIGEITLT